MQSNWCKVIIRNPQYLKIILHHQKTGIFHIFINLLETSLQHNQTLRWPTTDLKLSGKVWVEIRCSHVDQHYRMNLYHADQNYCRIKCQHASWFYWSYVEFLRICVCFGVLMLHWHFSLSAGIFSPVSTQNMIPHISSSTQAPSLASSSQSCLSFTEYGYLGSTNTDRTLDFNHKHWTCSFLFLLNCFMFSVWGEENQLDLSVLYRLCGVI